mmetsp:Transcript_106736/g.298791  ORF Transcript_106736/g.298791 Transcript_106736/m.298791 type:complete len:209 (-) Transcript_106736:107-733(-)
MREAIHPDVLVEKLLVEVASDRVVDVALLRLRSGSGLVLEHRVVVPLPLQAQVARRRRRLEQWVSFEDLLAPRALVHLVLLRLGGQLIGLALLLDLRELAHQLLGVLILVVVAALVLRRLRLLGHVLVGILWEGVGDRGHRRLARGLAVALLRGLALLGLELLPELAAGAALLGEALPRLSRLQLREARGVPVRHLRRLRHEASAAGV